MDKELIERFKRECFIHCDYGEDYTKNEYDMDKFAELIIQECQRQKVYVVLIDSYGWKIEGADQIFSSKEKAEQCLSTKYTTLPVDRYEEYICETEVQ